jgi:hypothetical protein
MNQKSSRGTYALHASYTYMQRLSQ